MLCYLTQDAWCCAPFPNGSRDAGSHSSNHELIRSESDSKSYPPLQNKSVHIMCFEWIMCMHDHGISADRGSGMRMHTHVLLKLFQ
jgi:hypothetical protein